MLTLLRRAGRAAPVLGLLGLLCLVASEAAAHGGDASLVHACVQDASGRARIVAPDANCQPMEHPVDWSQGGNTTPALPEVVDATGAPVGPAVGVSGATVLVGLRAGERLAVLPMGLAGYAGSDSVVFESPDCSAPAYLVAFPMLLSLAIPDDQGRVYADNGQPGVRITVRSYTVAGTCQTGVFFPGLDVVPAVMVLDLREFTAPFRLR